MMLSKVKKSYLSSTIPIKCKLLTSQSALKSTISNYPSCKPLNTKKWPTYLIKENNSEPFYILELRNDKILFTTYSTISPLYSLKDSLLRILSLASVFSDDYVMYIDTILPYMLNFMLKEDYKSYPHYNYSKEPELILSRRIIHLISENKTLKNTVSSLNNNLIKSTSALIMAKYSSDSNIKQIEAATGLSSQYVSDILIMIQQNGNRLVYNKKGNFDIVRI